MLKDKTILLLPVAGVVIFVVLYLVATLYYPGGSQANHNDIGFSWTSNYWCNLLDKTAINGSENSARPIALTGMLVLVISLSIFFFAVPFALDIPSRLKRMISFAGIASMMSVLFLEVGSHDFILNIAGVFGFVAFGGIVSILLKMKWYGLAVNGFINLFLVAVNNLLYYNAGWIHLLPLVQKITFLCFLIWISSICLRVYRMGANERSKH
ncbi:MAG TPA: hypothetical protein VK166_00450 [Chitinophagaceae bacterium]|nr:hypothetical protein [Chitinophagaceae bacterium]